MKYLLEPMDNDARQKVLEDAKACDIEKWKSLNTAPLLRCTPDLPWAVDYENNSYLILAPRMREESLEGRYYFHFMNRLYALHTESWLTDVVHFKDTPPPPDIIRGLVEAIREAFTVFGRSGFGNSEPLDNFNFSAFVIPELEGAD